MHVLYLVHQFYPEWYTGTEKFVLDLASMMQKAGTQVTVLTYSFYEAAAYTKSSGRLLVREFLYQGIPVIALRHKRPVRDMNYALENAEMARVTQDILSRVQPDVVHVAHTMRMGEFVLSLPTLNLPYLVTLTDFFLICPKYTLLTSRQTLCSGPEGGQACQRLCPELPQTFIHQRLAVAAKVLRHAQHVIAPSQFLASIFQQAMPELSVQVIGYGMASRTAKRHEKRYASGDALTFCYAGSLNAHKGVHVLIEAFQRLTDPRARLLIYGSSPDRTYRDRIATLAQRDPRISFGEVYKPEQVGEILSQVDMLVIPSLWYENTPIVLREAMACNVPVIASDVGGIAEDIQHGINGLLVRMGDARHLAQMLQKVIDNPPLLNALKRQMNNNVIPSVEQAAYSYARLYMQLARSSVSDGDGSRHLVNRSLPKGLGNESDRASAHDGLLSRMFGAVGERARFLYDSVRERLLAETRRRKLYNGLTPPGTSGADRDFERARIATCPQPEQTATADAYQLWLKRYAFAPQQLGEASAEMQKFSYQPTISIIMPVYNTDETWLRRAIESVKDQIYPHWELCLCDDGSTAGHVARVLAEYAAQDPRMRVSWRAQNGGISAASNGALALASGEFVGLLDHDDELTADALFEVVKLLNNEPALDFIYTDEDKLSPEGQRVEPFFKPDWSPDLFLSMNYIAHFAVIRRSVCEAIGGFTEGLEGSQDYDLFLRITEKAQKIGHIAKPLYSWRKSPLSAASGAQAKPYAHLAGQRALQSHLQRLEIPAEVCTDEERPYRYRLRYRIDDQPQISIIIPTKDAVDLLKVCIDSIEAKTAYRHFEILILDNQSEEPATLEHLARSPHRVVPVPGPFNYSRINNIGATHARGGFLLFLNNDTEVITEEWLSALLEHAQRKEVGAVGAKLLYPNNTIQHAGVVLGCGGLAGHAFGAMQNGEHGYLDLPHIIRDCSAVTAACLMMRKAVFTEVNGFDERIRVAYNDIDLCLRIREKGYRIVYTPHATLYHIESATRKKLHPVEDEVYFRTRWGSVIQSGDPYYNTHLSLERLDYNSLRLLDGRGSPSESAGVRTPEK